MFFVVLFAQWLLISLAAKMFFC